ncbi:hypothetical protein PENTCL1PPCAC_10133, partial [Pristionchus entomophagus]
PVLPLYLDLAVIDVIIMTARNDKCALRVRIDAAMTISDALCTDKVFRHDIISKGALDMFVQCVDAADEEISEACVRGIRLVLECYDSRKSSATGVSQGLAKIAQMYSIGGHSLTSTREAMLCLSIFADGPDPSQTLLRTILAAITTAMCDYPEDTEVVERSLAALENRIADYSREVTLGVFLAQPRLLECCVSGMGCGIKAIEDSALTIIRNLLWRHNPTRRQMKQLLNSDERFLETLENSANPSKMGVLRGHATATFRSQVCGVLSDILESLLDKPRPRMLSLFLGYGVLNVIIAYLSKEDANDWQGMSWVIDY